MNTLDACGGILLVAKLMESVSFWLTGTLVDIAGLPLSKKMHGLSARREVHSFGAGGCNCLTCSKHASGVNMANAWLESSNRTTIEKDIIAAAVVVHKGEKRNELTQICLARKNSCQTG